MIVCSRPASIGGALRGRHGRGGGMRWACRCCSVACPCRRTTSMRTVKSRGPDTPTLVSPAQRAQAALSRYGGQKARSTGENAKQPFQPLRGECRDVSAEPVVPAACILLAGGPWVRPAPGIPRALCLGEGRSIGKARTQSAPREREPMSHHRPCEEPKATKQSRVARTILDCFASLAMTARKRMPPGIRSANSLRWM